jgi:hypothetical protein
MVITDTSESVCLSVCLDLSLCKGLGAIVCDMMPLWVL